MVTEVLLEEFLATCELILAWRQEASALNEFGLVLTNAFHDNQRRGQLADGA